MGKDRVIPAPERASSKLGSWRRANAPLWDSRAGRRALRAIEAQEDRIDLEAARIAEEEAERLGMIPRDVLYAELGL